MRAALNPASPADDSRVYGRVRNEQAHAETVPIQVPPVTAQEEREALLRRATDLKTYLLALGDYSAATTIAALIRAVRS